MRDTFDNLGHTFGALVQVSNIDHFDLVDDPFVIAYRARGGITRTGAFDPTKTYVTREVAERQAIRDHFVLEMFDRFVRNQGGQSFDNPFANAGVTLELNAAKPRFSGPRPRRHRRAD